MTVLGIETATRVGTIALFDQERANAQILISDNMKHSGKFEGALSELFSKSNKSLKEVDGFAVSVGPGSFTGIRVGLAIAKGLSFQSERPIVGVPTLMALAYSLNEPEKLLCPIIAGESGEVYCALYQSIDHLPDLLHPESCLKLDEFLKWVPQDAVIFGPALLKYEKELNDQKMVMTEVCYPQARDVATIGAQFIKEGKLECSARYVKGLKFLEVIRKEKNAS